MSLCTCAVIKTLLQTRNGGFEEVRLILKTLHAVALVELGVAVEHFPPPLLLRFQYLVAAVAVRCLNAINQRHDHKLRLGL